MKQEARDASQEPIEVKLIAAAMHPGVIVVTPEKCEAIRKILARQANQPQPRKYVSIDTARLGQEPHFGCIEDADSTFCDDPKCWCAEPQGKAQPDSGEMGQEVDRWPLCCQESYDFGFQMGKVAGSREMAEKAAQVCDNYGADETDWDGYDCETAAALAAKIRSLASAEPPQGEAEKEGRT